MKKIIFLLLLPILIECTDRPVTIAILAKDKADTLPLYLTCIEKQTLPKSQTYLYVRTNNNNDETAAILKNWLARVSHLYRGVYFDETDVPERVQDFGKHEWNHIRFKVLGKIRQDSVDWARAHESHYFVADCDNFILPHTIQSLLEVNLPIVAPLLYSNCAYSNYHTAIDANGYHIDHRMYLPILNREIVGLIEQPVVHCTYLIRYEYLDQMTYDDNSWRYEYVIFSDNARKKGIKQYLDNRDVYGNLTLCENSLELVQEPWFSEFNRRLFSFNNEQ